MRQINEVFNGARSVSSLTFKVLATGIVILILLYPKSKIESLITERASNRTTAEQEIGEMWGGPQTVKGPVVLVPYWQETHQPDQGQRVKKYTKFLPEHLSVTGHVGSQELLRSIYKLIVYQSDLKISGVFRRPDFGKLGIAEQQILWEEAILQVSVSDIRSIRENVVMEWSGKGIELESGLTTQELFINGLETPIMFPNDDQDMPFSFDLKLNGSESISFLPMAKSTRVALTSDWSTPSFIGHYLPASRSLSDNGFSAGWNILSLNRDFPQSWTETSYRLHESAFGVTLFQPVSTYQKTTRSVKYSMLVIFLTFLVFFIIESLTGSHIHPVQYGMIGLALILFYTLLLSLSEYIVFFQAYLIAALMIIATISIYASAVFQSLKRGFVVAVITSLLYVFIYVIIESAQYSLLIGSFGLWLTLAIAMYFSRKIKWNKPHREIIEQTAARG